MATTYVGLDLGSSTTTAVIIDLDSRRVVGTRSAGATAAETTVAADKLAGRSEWDLDALVALTVDCAATLIAETGAAPAAIGVTGQQQGLQLLDAALQRVGPFLSWQDRRALDPVAGGGGSYLKAMADHGGASAEESGLYTFPDAGCPLAPGYTAPLLYWLQQNGQLPPGAIATMAPDFLVSRLTGELPRPDATDALGWGVYDVVRGAWSLSVIDALGLPRSLLPELASSCSVAGALQPALAQRLGVLEGLPVAVASGDHQCSFAGTVAEYANTVAVNIGTGGQASVHVREPLPRGWLELRPYIQSGYLLAGVGVVGGRTVRVMRDFFVDAVAGLSTASIDPDSVYGRLVELATAVAPGAEGVRVEPLFTGSRRDQRATGEFSGLTSRTFTVGHLARALFEGMARHLAEAYRAAVASGAGERSRLVGSGNAVRLNPVLEAALAAEFGMQVESRPYSEEAATGAALCAAVADGAFESIDAASAYFCGPDDR